MTDLIAEPVDAVELEVFELSAASADAIDAQLSDRLVDQARSCGLQLAGEGGLLAQLTKRLLESALEGEIADHLGYDKHDPAGKNGGNSRNGSRAKTVLTEVGSTCRATATACSSRRSLPSGSDGCQESTNW